MKLWKKIFIALPLGAFVGIILGPKAEYLKPVGQLFIGMLSMIVMPLILASMTVGITSIHDPKKLGRVGVKTLILYLVTTLLAIGIGLFIADFFKPGIGIGLTAEINSHKTSKLPTILDIILTLIPTNPMKALAEGNVLQVIIFSVFFGLGINFSKEKGRPVLAFMQSLSDVMFSITNMVMEFSPIGVFALIAWVAGTFGLTILLPLLKFLGLYYAACLIHLLFVLCASLKICANLNPIPFLRGMADAIAMAFSTCSSSATLPVTLRCVQNNLGVSKNISSFVLPLGSTVNMNGSALFQAMSALFIAQIYGIELGGESLIMIVITATLSSIGAAGIPGSGLIMLTVVLSSAGIPIEGLAILAGIDRLRDMASTVINILGDASSAIIVAKQEGEFDEVKYLSREKLAS